MIEIDTVQFAAEQFGRADEARLIGRFLQVRGLESSPEVRAALSMIRAQIALGEHRSATPKDINSAAGARK